MLYHFVSYGVTARHAPDRLRSSRRLGPRTQAQTDRGRGECLSARNSARKFAEIARDVRRQADGRHGPLRGSSGGRAARQSSAGGRLCHHHHAQNAPRPAGRFMPVPRKQYAKEINQPRIPRPAGRSADARDRRQGDLLWRSAAAGVQNSTPGRSSTMPKALAEVLLAGGLKLVSGGTDNHLMLVDVTPLGIGGKLAEAGPRPLRHHGQQEHDSLRPAQTDGSLGDSCRHPALTTRGMGPGEMRQVGQWILSRSASPGRALDVRQITCDDCGYVSTVSCAGNGCGDRVTVRCPWRGSRPSDHVASLVTIPSAGSEPRCPNPAF